MAQALVLDTHAWAWSIHAVGRLTSAARDGMAEATALYVSPISLFEVGQKARLGKWAEMEPLADNLIGLLQRQGLFAAPLTPEICLRAARLDWDHRDPFDRIIAATALAMDLPLVTRDPAFAGLKGLRLLW